MHIDFTAGILVSLHMKYPLKIPCGLTDEMRDVWRAFLELAGVEKDGASFRVVSKNSDENEEKGITKKRG